jgi:hypothetical protein
LAKIANKVLITFTPGFGIRTHGHWIFALQAGTIEAAEFHQVLQEVTNFPLKPFVLPFLKLNIPILSREVATVAAAGDLGPILRNCISAEKAFGQIVILIFWTEIPPKSNI